MPGRPDFLLDLPLRALSAWWVQLQCCGRTNCLPFKMLAAERQPGFRLGDTLPLLRCRQCGSRPGRVTLLLDPADRAQGRTGAPGGWRIEIVLPDPGYQNGP